METRFIGANINFETISLSIGMINGDDLYARHQPKKKNQLHIWLLDYLRIL